jgi:small conductance mechanosensitive channel
MNLDKLSETLVGKLIGWVEAFVAMLPNFVVAILVVIAFWFASRLVYKLVCRALDRVQTNAAARDLMARILSLAIILIGVVVALGVLNLDKALASVLAGAGIIGLALGFAFQDLASNLISGVGLAMNQRWPFKIGDLVETNDVFGVVKKIQLRTSTIETLDGKTVFLPNRQIYQSTVINHSATGRRRVDVECGISYGDNLEKVASVVKKAIEGLDCRDKSKEVQFFYSGFGDSSINFVAHFWIQYDKQPDFLNAQSDGILALKKAFDEHDIMIPFPIRTLDFGIRGGKTLSQVLSSAPLTVKSGAM